MGYRRIPTIYTLNEIPEEDGLVVRMKGVTFGRIRRMLKLIDSTEDDGSVEEIASMFVDNLVSWNLEDEDGTPVPVTAEGVEDQDFSFILKIVNAWLDQVTGVDKELGKDSTSGGSFPGQPLTMEAL